MFDKDAEITHDAVLEKMGEILKIRGKKKTDRHEMVSLSFRFRLDCKLCSSALCFRW